jgi:hypothetical protein
MSKRTCEIFSLCNNLKNNLWNKSYNVPQDKHSSYAMSAQILPFNRKFANMIRLPNMCASSKSVFDLLPSAANFVNYAQFKMSFIFLHNRRMSCYTNLLPLI